MDTGFFIGRDRELEILISEISESDQFRDPSRIFYLSGDKGMGKRSFLSQLWKSLQRTPLQILWIRPEQTWLQTNRHGEWLSLFINSMQANNSSLNERLAEFKKGHSNAFSPNFAMGSSGTQGSPEADWLDQFAQKVFNQKSIHSGGIDKNLRIIFVVDNYDQLDSARKDWFANVIFNPMVSAVPDLDVRFLLSGAESYTRSSDIENYWGAFQTEVCEVKLPPLSPEETRDFASRMKIILGDDFDLYEATGGIPEKIQSVLASGKIKSTALHRVSDIESIFADLNQEMRNWVLGASHLRIFNDESLSIFGTAEGARKARKWLCQQDFLKIEKLPTGFRVDSSWADSLLHWQERYQPDQYRKLAAKVESYREVCQAIRSLEHREKLAKLSVLNFFNEDVVNKVYGDEASSLNAFVRNHLEYFIKTPFNYQISMRFQPLVANYVRLIPIDNKEQLREKTAYLWGKRREAAVQEMAEIEKKLIKEKDAFKNNRVYLDPILKQINQRMRALAREQKRQARKTKPAAASKEVTVKKTAGITYFFNISGLVVLAVGMLVKVPVDWDYVTLGILFLVLGTFWSPDAPSTQETPKQAARSPRAASNPAEEDTMVALLNLKRVGLENKSSYLAMQMSRSQRRLHELDTLLNEPYIYK